MKTCKICNRSLDVACFSGRSLRCKECYNELARAVHKLNPEKRRAIGRKHDRNRDREHTNELRRKRYHANPEKARERQLHVYYANREHINELRRIARHENIEKEREKARNWARSNPEKVRENRRKLRQANPERIREGRRRSHQRLRENPIYRLIRACRSRITKALRGRDKSARTQELIGCTWEELRRHIESQFTKGMNWNNRGFGAGKWNIEHEKPFALFPNLTPKEQKIVCNWRNLRPMWQPDNLKKGTKWTGTIPLLEC